MPGFFDRLGKAAQQTAAEGKLRLDIRNINGQIDAKAQALGHLMYRQHKGETIADAEYTQVLGEMAQFEAERQAKEAELEELKKPEPVPPPAPVAATPTTPPPSAPAPDASMPPAAPAAGGMFCASCGATLAPGAKFCASCGSKVG